MKNVYVLTVYGKTPEGDNEIEGQAVGDWASMSATAILCGSGDDPKMHFNLSSTDIPWGLSSKELSTAVEKHLPCGSIEYHP